MNIIRRRRVSMLRLLMTDQQCYSTPGMLEAVRDYVMAQKLNVVFKPILSEDDEILYEVIKLD